MKRKSREWFPEKRYDCLAFANNVLLALTLMIMFAQILCLAQLQEFPCELFGQKATIAKEDRLGIVGKKCPLFLHEMVAGT